MTCAIFQVSSDQAREFWRQQRDARIFLNPEVLEPLCQRVDWWLATWKEHPVCLWPMCTTHDGQHRPPELSAYVGPLWDDSVLQNKAARWWSITRCVQQQFLEVFLQRYREFTFELPPETQDIRVFQWFQDAGDGKWQVKITCRHTAVMTLPVAGNEDVLLSQFSRNRVKDIRRMRRSACFNEWSHPDASALFSLYESMLQRKARGAHAQSRQLEVRELTRLATSGFGRVVAHRDETKDQFSFVLSLHTPTTASLVLAASSHAANCQGTQAFVQHELLLRNMAQGIRNVDFLGANSPVGAEEKHRYGAWPLIYFRVTVSSP